MGPPAMSPELGGSSSKPPLVPTRDAGASSSVVPEVGSSGGVSLIIPPPIPYDIIYTGVGLRQYHVPDIPIPDGYLSFLGDRPDDEVVSIRAGDLRSIYTSSFCNWNLLQYLGRDPLSFSADHWRTVEASLQQGDPIYVSRSQSRSESRRSDSRTSRRSQSSIIRPTASIRTAEVSQTTPAAADPPQVSRPPEAREISGDSESVSKRSRHD